MRHDLAMALDPSLLMARSGTTPDPWQAEFLRNRASKTLLLCSRQAGKSTVTAVAALHEALFYSPSLVLLLSPSLRQSQELFRKVLTAFRTIQGSQKVEESTLRLELPNGSRIVSLPGRDETIRGFSGVGLLVIDEAAWVADSLYYAVKPMLAVSKGRLIALSTPMGKRGWFHREWVDGQDWQKIKVTAHDCPRISAEFLEGERLSMPMGRFSSEYLCEFNDTDDSVFSHENVIDALSPAIKPLFGGNICFS